MAPFPDVGPVPLHRLGHEALGAQAHRARPLSWPCTLTSPLPDSTASRRDCLERFGVPRLERITQDDDVICSTEYSRIVPLENGEVGQAGAAGSAGGGGSQVPA